MQEREKGLPQGGLFELQTNWRRAAAVAVRDYLVAALAKAGSAVPVFA